MNDDEEDCMMVIASPKVAQMSAGTDRRVDAHTEIR